MKREAGTLITCGKVVPKRREEPQLTFQDGVGVQVKSLALLSIEEVSAAAATDGRTDNNNNFQDKALVAAGRSAQNSGSHGYAKASFNEPKPRLSTGLATKPTPIYLWQQTKKHGQEKQLVPRLRPGLFAGLFGASIAHVGDLIGLRVQPVFSFKVNARFLVRVL